VIHITVSPTFWVIVALITLAAFFRFGQLSAIPGEMFSDHAEKLLDVNDVLNGQLSIFFPRNTGREAIQMYLTAVVSKLFGTGLSFMSLKIGTTLAGFLTLPFIYLLAKEISGKRVGLIAFFMAAIAYWPNVISRVGLRFPLYPLFVAPMLYFLIKGLKNGDRNQFIWAGLALGLGLHGYSPMRIVPIVVVVLLGLYMLFPSSKGKRQQVMMGLVILAVVAFVVFLPLLRYAYDDPQMFALRAFSRLSTTERAFPASPILIFFQNLWKSMIMFFWNNGNIWVHSVSNRPALDVVSAVFLFFGMGITLWRSIRQRSWVDAILFVSIPLLMLPSILSLAFPEENPSLNRSGGAIIPVFITAAIGFDTLFSSLIKGLKSQMGKILGYLFTGMLVLMTISQNYDLVFRQYKTQFDAGAWNTSEMGAVIRNFAESTGNFDTAYVVPVAYWVDTRLVGINAGVPIKDYALWPDSFASTLDEPRSKLFLVKADDNADLDLLLQFYPDAAVYLFDQSLEGKDFWIVYVPPAR
ncbi:MAG: glycosyltransferase family 39 protein, partial [Anaerolineaceae bacterium]